MKIVKFIFFTLFLFLISTSSIFAQDTDKIYLFYGTGCPHCAQVDNFFETNKLIEKYNVDKKEIYFNRENAILFNLIMDQLNIPQNDRGVPAVVIGKKILIGDTPIIENFVIEADKFLEDKKISNTTTTTLERNPALTTTTKLSVQNTDTKDSNRLTFLAVILGALVDSINPCEFAVLIILMTTILSSGNSKNALKAGLAFSLSIFISYFLMGLGFYKALDFGGISGWFFKFIGWLAIILGILNLKDYLWYGKGFLMEVPLSWRPKLKSIISSVTNPRGAFMIGFLVSLFLLPCTSGPYIVILGMLANKTELVKAISYLVLYNLIFIFPMVFISYAVYRGFDPKKAEEIRQSKLRILHLIAGIIMLGMGVIIVSGLI